MNDTTIQSEAQTDQAPDANLAGQAYWRSLGEYAKSEHIEQLLADEFTGYDPKDIMSMSRRRFFQLMGASMALAGVTLTGCRRWPQEKIAPFASRPEGYIPGTTNKYATLCERNGYAVPAMVTAFDGRPIKLAGNPNHAMSPNGSSDVYLQAETLSLYDPYRARSIKQRKTRSGKLETIGRSTQQGWDGFYNWCRANFDGAVSGNKIAVLHEPTSSPTFAAMQKAWRAQTPGVEFYAWSPVNRDNAIAGSKLASGTGAAAATSTKPLRPHYDLSKAKRIVSLGGDLFSDRPDALKLAHDWSTLRRSCDQGEMSRMYAVESTLSLSGSVAEHRLAMPMGMIPALAGAMAQRLMPMGRNLYPLSDEQAEFVNVVIEDLESHGGSSVIIPSLQMPAEVHALCMAMNAAIGAVGKTMHFTDEPEAQEKTKLEQITALAKRLEAGDIEQLIILGGNPAYDAPADLKLADGIAKTPSVIHLTHEENETSEIATWVLPQAHFLESWGDARAFDGTLSVQQPLILPLFDGKTPLEVLDILSSNDPQSNYDMIRWVFKNQNLLPDGEFEDQWRIALHDGLVKDSAFAKASSNVRFSHPMSVAFKDSGKTDEMEVVFQADPSIMDGRFAGNGWLQETPRPMTKLTWDNAALISVKDAERLDVETGNHLDITIGDQTVKLPVFRMPGQAPGTITIQLGYGRTAGSPVAMNVGQNVYPLRRSGAMDAAMAKVTKAGGYYELACTVEHHLIDGTAPPSAATESAEWALKKRLGKPGKSGYIVKEATLDEYKKNPHFVHDMDHGNLSLQLFEQNPDFRAGPHAWGMTVDMTACMGCNACVTACQSENNIPVVGRDQVRMSREMHWLRIDRYYKGKPDNPDVVHMPVACVHCENAPCEQVCPVAATVHDTEGLNTMVYNRCIGTRYCSNNCPYKVRRFNYFDYHAKKTPNATSMPWLGIPDQQQQSIPDLKRMIFNPDVTVRMRGVMEKCTFCTQRIQEAKSQARIRAAENPLDDGLVKDGEVVTACQEACPTSAITFGDLNDKDSKVTKHQKLPRAYSLLAELNTRPRTQHLAKIFNPNPKLKKKTDQKNGYDKTPVPAKDQA